MHMPPSFGLAGPRFFGANYTRLLIALRDAASGDLIFVEMNEPAEKSRQLPEQLAHDGLARPFQILDLKDLDPARTTLVHVLRKALSGHAGTEIMFVYGLEHLIGPDPKPGGALEALNLDRERLSEQGVVLVFLLPTYSMDSIRARAFNLWTWRAHHYVLEEPRAPSETIWLRPRDDAGVQPKTPEGRERDIRILRGLLEDGLAQNRSLGSLTHSVVVPLIQALDNAGRVREALSVLERIQPCPEKAPDSEETARLLNARAVMLQTLGNFDQAMALSKRALEIKKRVLGDQHVEFAEGLNNLAVLHHDRGAYDEAERLYSKARAVLEKALGAEHPSVALILNNLAETYAIQGKDREAEALFQRARALAEAALGPDHPDVAGILTNLATLYGVQGRHAEAQTLIERALAVQRQTLGDRHPAVAEGLRTLAHLHAARGEYVDARGEIRKAIEVLESSLGSEHTAVAKCFDTLAQIEAGLGHNDDAEAYLKKALQIFEAALGPDHPHVAAALENYARLLRTTRRDAEAEGLEARAARIRATQALKRSASQHDPSL